MLKAIAECFLLPQLIPGEVLSADVRMLATERRDLMTHGPEWGSIAHVEPYGDRILPVPSAHAEIAFMEMFNTLMSYESQGERR